MELSVQEAQRLDHGHVGTEHLLLGILADGASPAAVALVQSGASLAGCREMAAELVGNRGGPSTRTGELPYTERANRSLERAARLALRRRDPQVEPTHILMSLLDVEGRAGQVLRGLSVDLPAVRRRLDSPEENGDVAAPDSVVGDAVVGRAGPEPLCAQCGTTLADHLAHQTLESRRGGEAVMRFVVAYCASCGAALGATPTGHV